MKRSVEEANRDYTLRHKRRRVQKQVEKSMERILSIIQESKRRQEFNRYLNEIQSQATDLNHSTQSKLNENYEARKISTYTKNDDIVESQQQENDLVAVHNIEAENEMFDNTPWDLVDDKIIFQDLESEYRYSDYSDEEEDSEKDNATANKVQEVTAPPAKETRNVADDISKHLKCMLPAWASDNYITRTAFTDLLHRFREEIHDLLLPLDSRTLSKTAECGQVYPISGGDYCHFGLEACLEKIVIERRINNNKNINIDLLINIDGAPMGQSSAKNLWPILCSEKLSKKVHMIGIFCGSAKPDDANEFLKFFVDELKNFVINGILLYNIRYNVSVDGIICDAPAKAYILGIKNHTGYLCCSKCDIHGVWIKTVCFPGKIGALRTDECFRTFSYYDGNKGYQMKRTILNEIPRLGLVTQVPLDPMHLVFVGVTRKLFLIWMFGRVSYKLPYISICNISNVMLRLSDHITYEFARRPRHLRYLKNFKATELRQLCLYTGVIVLKDYVSRAVYDHFVTFHVAMSILSNPLFCKIESWIAYAEKLNEKFVENFQKLYGRRYLSYNVHNMYHIADDVRRYGELENFSAFKFENFIGHIKRLLRSGRQPLQQLMRRTAEIENNQKRVPSVFRKKECDLQQPHSNGPITDNFQNVEQYKVGIFNSFKINCGDSKNNNVFIDNKHVVKAHNLIRNDTKETYLIGETLKIIGPLYTYPCSSSKLGINIIKEDTDANLEYWNIDKITAKLLKLPYNDQFVVFPILHTLREANAREDS